MKAPSENRSALPSRTKLLATNLELYARLEEADETLRAIRHGEVDALVIEDASGVRLYTLQGQDADASRLRGEMLAQVSDAVIAFDPAGCIVYLNAAAERLYGVATSWALGRTLAKICRARLPQGDSEAAAESALPERGSWRGDSTHLTLDGRTLDVEMSVTALRQMGGSPGGRLAIIRDVTERKQRENRVLISETRYRRLFETTQDGIAILDPGTRRIVDANPFLARLLGYTHDELVGKELFEIGLLKNEAESRKMAQDLQRATQVRYDDVPVDHPGRRHLDVEIVCNLYDEAGSPVIHCSIRDITERKRAEKHAQFLMAEVNHRARNLLAVVQAIASQTAKHGDPATFAVRLADRLEGVAAGQDLLIENQWQGIDITDLVHAQLASFGDLIGSRILVAGPTARLTAAAAQAIGMALHELATNAAKYGALSNANGRVLITWQLTDAADPIFSMSWLEEGGPKVVAPTRRGFGHTVIGRMAEAAVDGKVEIAYRETGLSWTLSTPEANALSLAEVAAATPTVASVATTPGNPTGRILLVEDEPALAFAIEELLVEAGFEFGGVANRLGPALEMIENGAWDAVILDANLAGVSSGPVAEALTARGVPFLVLSGYSASQQPEAFSRALRLQKPCRPQHLIRALRSILPATKTLG